MLTGRGVGFDRVGDGDRNSSEHHLHHRSNYLGDGDSFMAMLFLHGFGRSVDVRALAGEQLDGVDRHRRIQRDPGIRCLAGAGSGDYAHWECNQLHDHQPDSR